MMVLSMATQSPQRNGGQGSPAFEPPSFVAAPAANGCTWGEEPGAGRYLPSPHPFTLETSLWVEGTAQQSQSAGRSRRGAHRGWRHRASRRTERPRSQGGLEARCVGGHTPGRKDAVGDALGGGRWEAGGSCSASGGGGRPVWTQLRQKRQDVSWGLALCTDIDSESPFCHSLRGAVGRLARPQWRIPCPHWHASNSLYE